MCLEHSAGWKKSLTTGVQRLVLVRVTNSNANPHPQPHRKGQEVRHADTGSPGRGCRLLLLLLP